MAKANPGKPSASRKAGNELPYKNVADVIGGPPCNDPQPGLNPDKPVKGDAKLPAVKK